MIDLSEYPLIAPNEGVSLFGGSSALYHKMLLAFIQEPTMNLLLNAVAKCDVHQAFLYAHTLKGLCAQLALPRLQAEACVLCDLLRKETNDMPPDVPPLIGAMQSIYLDTISSIKSLKL